LLPTNKQKQIIMKNLTDEQKIKIITNEANYWTSVLNECTKEDVYFLAEKMEINTIHPTSKRKVNKNDLISLIKYNKAAEMRDFLRNK